MKDRKSQENLSSEGTLLNEIFVSIHDKMLILDKLNEDYKNRQEEHFIKSFMNVVEKMGNDLILAQEAYRNIDIEVKRDDYCVELTKQLQFFKSNCFQFKSMLEKNEKEMQILKFDNENQLAENAALKQNLQKKIKENMYLKSQNKELLRRLNEANSKNLAFMTAPLQTPSKSLAFDRGEINRYYHTDRQLLATQGGFRAHINSMKNSSEDRPTISRTPKSDFFDIEEQEEKKKTMFTMSFRRGGSRKVQNKN